MDDKRYKASLLFATMLLFTASSQAGLITLTQTRTNNFIGPFTFGAFDGTLGTLTSVRLDYDLTAIFRGEEEPPDIVCDRLNCSGTIKLAIEATPPPVGVGFALYPFADQISQSIDTDEIDGVVTTLFLNSSHTYSSPLIFTSTSPFEIGSLTVRSVVDGGDLEEVVGGDYPQGTVSLVYVYDDAGGSGGNGTVPEPTTLALFGLGLAGIGYQRRKRAE